jgi:hypothetical protein
MSKKKRSPFAVGMTSRAIEIAIKRTGRSQTTLPSAPNVYRTHIEPDGITLVQEWDSKKADYVVTSIEGENDV